MIKKYVSLKPFSGNIYRNNRIFEINNGSNIFYKFKSELKNLGIEINTIDAYSKNRTDVYMYCDIPYPWEISLWKLLILNRNRNILFCFESPLINPFSHMSFLYVFFKHIYTWNDKLVDSKKKSKFYIPQLNPPGKLRKVKFIEKNFLILINSNKTVPLILRVLSPYKKELYGERIKAIRFFEKTIPNKFNLYGRGWNRSRKLSIKDKIFGYKKYFTYKGEARNKIKLLSGFKFSLCFENCVADGYITEKIFDCFYARCVPIYLGAPNISDYIDKRCFIDFRDFANYESMISFLDGITEKRYEEYIDSINKMLISKKFREKWLGDGFRKTIIEGIHRC